MTDEARDETIARAASAYREESHGRSDAAAETRARILATRGAQTQRATFWMAAAAALVLGLGLPTAWAWSTGRLDRWLETTDRSSADPTAVEGGLDHAHVPDREVIDQEVTSPDPQAVDQELAEQEVAEVADRDVVDQDHEVVARDVVGRDRDVADHEAVDHGAVDHEAVDPSTVSPPVDLEDEGVDPEERLAFQRADALHTARDANAITAWDAYLGRYPEGRFAIEARYARALCLVRLGRRDEAREALAPFAEGRFGRYREREATALIEALTR